MTDTRKKILQFPMEFSNGRMVISDDPGAELDMILEYPAGRRTVLLDYGIDAKQLQQSTIDQLMLSSVTLVEIRDKFRKFLRNVTLVKARIYKKQERRRAIFIEIIYKENNLEKSKQFEIKTA